MTDPNEIVFLLDVDNTLLDNDTVRRELHEHLGSEFGPDARVRLAYATPAAERRRARARMTCGELI